MLVPGCQTPLPSCGASRATSESNLSSSGYSSGTSRCGSSNPLCISESEDTATPTSNTTTFFPGCHGLGFVRRPSPLLKSPSCDSESSDQQNYRSVQRFGGFTSRTVGVFNRYRTDSETTDEQVPMECLSIAEGPADSNDEGIGAELPVDAKNVPTMKEIGDKESPWTQTGLPEIVVQPCFTIHEQESTESTKSSRHNSMDEPAKSSSSSRSSSPAGSVQPSESEGASATGEAIAKDQGGGGKKVEEGSSRGGRKTSPRRRGRRRKESGSTSPAGNSRLGSPRDGSSTERKAGQRLRSQVKINLTFGGEQMLKNTLRQESSCQPPARTRALPRTAARRGRQSSRLPTAPHTHPQMKAKRRRR